MSNKVFIPRFFFDFIIFKPCFTKALFKPFKGTTSQIVPNVTKSRQLIKLGSFILFCKNQSFFLSSLFNETKKIKVTPAAQRYFRSELSSKRFGFIIEKAFALNAIMAKK